MCLHNATEIKKSGYTKYTVCWSKKKFSVIVNDFECIFTLTLTFDSAVLDRGKTSLARTNNNNLLFYQGLKL